MDLRTRYQNALARPTVPILGRIGARVELDHTRLPAAIEGTSSVVFRLVANDGAKLALRLPASETAGAEWPVRYGALSALQGDALRQRLPAALDLHRQGVSVAQEDGSVVNLPALVMRWIEGPTLMAAADRAARAENSGILRALAVAVRDAINDFRRAGFVHGDITAHNLLVDTNGRVVAVDLDTASWPGSPLGTTGSGSPAWRHPAGAASTAMRDGFAFLVLYTSLMALAEQPDRRRSWGEPLSSPDGGLLLTEWDLAAPQTSECLTDLRRQSGREVARLVEALEGALRDGPESIERHLRVVPDLAPLPEPVEPARSTGWDINEAFRRVKSRYTGTTTSTPTTPWAVPPAWETTMEPEPPLAPGEDLRARRDQLMQAIRDKREGDVARLWASLADEPVTRTLRLDVERVYADGYARRIEQEHRVGNDEAVLAIAAEAQHRQIPLATESRRHIRLARERLAVRNRLDQALGADAQDDLAHLAMSGTLVVLGDTDRRSLVRVLQALEWPLLQRALETDDDRLIVGAYDAELFEEADSLPPQVFARVDVGRARLQWAERMRAALRQRLAGEVVALLDEAPEHAERHLSASERRRAHKMAEQHRALRQLAEAIHSNDEADIVQALAVVERVGARLGAQFPWHAIRDVLERVSLIEDIIEAARAVPIDYVRLAQLIPAARAIGLDADPRLSGEFDLDDLQSRVIRAAHLRRVRLAIARDDDAAIVVTALPDVYEVLDELTEPERDRVAVAIRSQRRRNRGAVAARFA